MNGPHWYIGGWLWYPFRGLVLAEMDYSPEPHGRNWLLEVLGDVWARRN